MYLEIRIVGRCSTLTARGSADELIQAKSLLARRVEGRAAFYKNKEHLAC